MKTLFKIYLDNSYFFNPFIQFSALENRSKKTGKNGYFQENFWINFLTQYNIIEYLDHQKLWEDQVYSTRREILTVSANFCQKVQFRVFESNIREHSSYKIQIIDNRRDYTYFFEFYFLKTVSLSFLRAILKTSIPILRRYLKNKDYADPFLCNQIKKEVIFSLLLNKSFKEECELYETNRKKTYMNHYTFNPELEKGLFESSINLNYLDKDLIYLIRNSHEINISAKN